MSGYSARNATGKPTNLPIGYRLMKSNPNTLYKVKINLNGVRVCEGLLETPLGGTRIELPYLEGGHLTVDIAPHKPELDNEHLPTNRSL